MNERDLFIAALHQRDPAAREALLDEACVGDHALRMQVEELLREQEQLGSFLEQPAEGLGETGAFTPPEGGETLVALPEGPGTVIGPYELLEQIGEGGMGAVYLAQQSEPVKRLVALKVIKAGMDSRQVIVRFEAERQALALMDHPHIAKILDGGTTASGRPYFVMELVKGVPLTRYCDEHRLTPRQRLELFVSVCQAIQHAHQKGIIHRDVKPSNVLVALYDGQPVPKVIDFGIAKAVEQPLTEKTLVTGLGSVMGTLEYMSPEQAELNQLDVDTRSDVYSLGVLLYELLTSTTPLERKRLKDTGLLEALRLIREEEPARPSTRLSTTQQLPSIAANRGSEPKKLSGLVRGELDWIVMKALDKDRNRRYETANGLAMDVQRYLADEQVQACPPSTWYRLRKFARRNRGVLTAAALVSAALTLAVVVLAISNVRINDALAQAKINEEAATANAATAAQRAEDLARSLYIDRVNLAHREVMANNVARADALLGDCEPSRRGWEWDYTKRLCHLEAMTLGGFCDHASAVAGARRASPSTLALLAPRDQDGTIAGLMGGSGEVRSVSYSPDGRRIASAHDDGIIVLWDARTGQEIRSLTGHLGSVSSVTFDDDGGRLISGGYDGTVRVWDANTGQEKFVLRGHSRPVMSVAFRPGANQAASSEHGGFKTYVTPGFEIKQWDLLRGREIRTLHHAPGWSYSWIAFTPDGRRLLSSSYWSGQLYIWDAESGKKLKARRHPFPNLGLSVSPGDLRIAFGYQDGSLGLSDPRLGLGIRSLRGHSSQVAQVAFSRDGTRLASSSEEGTITVWSVADGREVKHLRGHTGAVTAIAFSPKGNSLVSGSADGTVKIWYVGPARDPYPLNLKKWVSRVRFAPDGRQTAIAIFDRVMVANTTSNRSIFQIPLQSGVTALAFSRDGRIIATGAIDRVCLLDADTGRSVANCQGHAGPIRAVAFGAANLLASAGDDGTVRFWDVPTGQARSVIDAHKGGTFSLAFDPAGTMLASLGWNGTVCLWDAPKSRLIRNFGRTVQRLSDHWGDALAFSPDGRRLAVGCADGTVHVWEVASGDEVFILRGHTREVTSVVYSPDGRRIAAAGWDHTIKLWDATTGDEVFTLRGHTGGVLGLAFSPDGFHLLSTGADGKVRAWDARPLEDKPAATLEPRSAVEWNGEGARYATQHRWVEAVHAYTAAIELEPNSWEAWQSRGLAYTNLHKDDKALADFTKAIELKPKYVPVIMNRGTTYIRLRQYDKALADFSKAIELDGAHWAAWNKRGLCQENLGQLEKALQDYSKVIELRGTDPLPWRNRGRIHARLRQYHKALADYSKLIELEPKNIAAWLQRSSVYAALGQWDKAAADLAEMCDLQPKEWRHRCNLAQALARQGRRDAARVEAVRAIELGEKDARAWVSVGNVYRDLGTLDDAIQHYDKAIELKGDEPDAWYQRGQTRLMQREWNLAVDDFSATIERSAKSPTVWLAHRARAEAYGLLHQFARARADYEKVLQLMPRSGEAHNNLAWFLANCSDAKYRDPARAVELAKKAVEWREQAGNFWNTLGVAHYRAGDWEEAVRALEKSMQLRKGGDASDWFFLAMTHQKLGNRDEARKWFDQAVQWQEKKKDTLQKNKALDEELPRFRSEAQEVLEQKKKQ